MDDGASQGTAEAGAAAAPQGGAEAGGGADASDKIAEKMQDKFGEGGEGGERPKTLRDFLMRGNILDLAVAVIIGAAFGRVVSSLVSDILMPPIGMLLGGVDFASLFINLTGKAYPSVDAAKAAGAATINYGVFLNQVIDFVIVGTVLFLFLRTVTRLTPQTKAPTPEVTTKVCPFCISNVPLNATRCPYCTSQLQATTVSGGIQGTPLTAR